MRRTDDDHVTRTARVVGAPPQRRLASRRVTPRATAAPGAARLRRHGHHARVQRDRLPASHRRRVARLRGRRPSAARSATPSASTGSSASSRPRARRCSRPSSRSPSRLPASASSSPDWSPPAVAPSIVSAGYREAIEAFWARERPAAGRASTRARSSPRTATTGPPWRMVCSAVFGDCPICGPGVLQGRRRRPAARGRRGRRRVRRRPLRPLHGAQGRRRLRQGRSGAALCRRGHRISSARRLPPRLADAARPGGRRRPGREPNRSLAITVTDPTIARRHSPTRRTRGRREPRQVPSARDLRARRPRRPADRVDAAAPAPQRPAVPQVRRSSAAAACWSTWRSST